LLRLAVRDRRQDAALDHAAALPLDRLPSSDPHAAADVLARALVQRMEELAVYMLAWRYPPDVNRPLFAITLAPSRPRPPTDATPAASAAPSAPAAPTSTMTTSANAHAAATGMAGAASLSASSSSSSSSSSSAAVVGAAASGTLAASPNFVCPSTLLIAISYELEELTMLLLRVRHPLRPPTPHP
jgi:hypothetical protein